MSAGRRNEETQGWQYRALGDYNAAVAKDDEAAALVMRLLAHDLRNPLTAVQLNSQLIERAAAEAGREKEQRWATLIAGAARRMDGLIQQLVEGERLRIGQLQLRREQILWDQLWRDSLARGAADFDASRIHLALPEARVSVLGDRERLGRAIRGLLGLAIQQADSGAMVAVEVEAKDGEARGSIHVSSPFGASAALSAIAGVSSPGIALYFARTVFECHGGSVRVASDEVQAPGFELILPTGPAT
jgi:signal transduction histidine kinase